MKAARRQREVVEAIRRSRGAACFTIINSRFLTIRLIGSAR